MQMNNYYVPVLKWKRGEQKAIEYLIPPIKDCILPLIEIPPKEIDWKTNTFKKSLYEHIVNIPTSLSSNFQNQSIFLDTFNIQADGLLQNGITPIEFISANTTNVNIIPVITSYDRTNYISALKTLLSNGIIHEICIRIMNHDLANLNDLLTNIISEYSITPEHFHIVFDLKEISMNNAPLYEATIPLLVNNMLGVHEWKSITLIATSFPRTLEQIKKNNIALLPRCEFPLWKNIVNNVSLKRYIQFGDYCISNPEYNDIDPRLLKTSGNIRYTIDNSFYVIKGVNTRDNGFSQMVNLSQNLIDSGHYCGQEYSYGDSYIFNCSQGTDGPGNSEVWRRVGTNHHITFLVNQLSTLSYF